MKLASAIVVLLTVAGAMCLTSAPAGEDVLIKDVPHVRQKPDFCGEACAEMFLRKLGNKIDQDDIFDRAGIDPVLARGCCTRDLVKSLKNVGFNVGSVWFPVNPGEAGSELDAQWKSLYADLVKGVPSIVCMHHDDQPSSAEHFRLILGYASKTDEVIYHEPATDDGAYQRMKKARFLSLWPLKYDEKKWTVIRIRLEPGDEIKEPKPREQITFTPADYAQHVIKLKGTLAGRDFAIIVQPPFVVLGDDSPAQVKRWSQQTVRWAVEMLKKDFFKNDPTDILDVWLFKNEESYEKYTKEIFGEEPTTPFGYYSQASGSLIMNIATGGGTLVHEIVHPFMRANFPKCPAWFNEGLASLYEQSTSRDGHICGLTNWRLKGLQAAIRAGTVPSFETLTQTTERQFYRSDPGTNYAQARYLCYYLQEKGLLVTFFKAFLANHKKDPSGFETLKTLLGENDMTAFQKKWEAFVLGLSFP